MERLDKVAEAMPAGLNLATRAERFKEQNRKRELASIALGEFQTKLVQNTERLRARSPDWKKSRPRCPPIPR